MRASRRHGGVRRRLCALKTKLRQGGGLIGFREARVANPIGCHNYGESTRETSLARPLPRGKGRCAKICGCNLEKRGKSTRNKDLPRGVLAIN